MTEVEQSMMREVERAIDAALAKLERHEAVCAERYKEIKDDLEDAAKERAEMRTDIRTMLRYGGALIGLIALTAVFEAKDVLDFIRAVVRGGG